MWCKLKYWYTNDTLNNLSNPSINERYFRLFDWVRVNRHSIGVQCMLIFMFLFLFHWYAVGILVESACLTLCFLFIQLSVVYSCVYRFNVCVSNRTIGLIAFISISLTFGLKSNVPFVHLLQFCFGWQMQWTFSFFSLFFFFWFVPCFIVSRWIFVFIWQNEIFLNVWHV